MSKRFKQMSPKELLDDYYDGECKKREECFNKRRVYDRYNSDTDIDIIIKDWTQYGGYHMFLKPDKKSVLLYGPRNTCAKCEVFIETFENYNFICEASDILKEKYNEFSNEKVTFLNKCDAERGCGSEALLHNIGNYDVYRFYIIWSAYEYIDFTDLDRFGSRR